MFDQIHSRYKGQHAPSPSLQALATQIIYVECRSNEETVDYEHHQSAQARFKLSQQTRIEKTESHTSSTHPRAPEKQSIAQMTSEEQFALSMAASCILTTAKIRLRAQTTGPPTQIQGSGGRDPEGDPLDSGRDDIPSDPDDLGPQDPHHN